MSIKNFLKDFLIEQDDNVVIISPEDYIELLENVGGIASRISALKQYRGKDIVISGDLDLTKFKNVGPLTGITRVKGKLDISNTNVPTLEGITVDGYVREWGSKMYTDRLQNAKNKKLEELKQYREDNEWSVGNEDDESERTEALFDYLVEEGIPETYEDENGNEVEEDKYFIYPNGSGTYGYGKQYQWLGGDSLYPESYDVYTEPEMDIAARRAVETMIDDMGVDAFSEWVFDDSLDQEEWEEWLYDFYEEPIREEPEDHNIEKELSDEQERQISQMGITIQNLTKKLQDGNLSDDDRQKIQTKIDGLEEIIEDIKENPEGDYSEDSIREAAENAAWDYRNNITQFIKDYGYDKTFLLKFLDLDELADTVVKSDGYGHLLSSSGKDMYETKINDTWYFVLPLE